MKNDAAATLDESTHVSHANRGPGRHRPEGSLKTYEHAVCLPGLFWKEQCSREKRKCFRGPSNLRGVSSWRLLVSCRKRRERLESKGGADAHTCPGTQGAMRRSWPVSWALGGRIPSNMPSPPLSPLPSPARPRVPCPPRGRAPTAEPTGSRLCGARGSETCGSSTLRSPHKTVSVPLPSLTRAVRRGFAQGKGDGGGRQLRVCVTRALKRALRRPAER